MEMAGDRDTYVSTLSATPRISNSDKKALDGTKPMGNDEGNGFGGGYQDGTGNGDGNVVGDGSWAFQRGFRDDSGNGKGNGNTPYWIGVGAGGLGNSSGGSTRAVREIGDGDSD